MQYIYLSITSISNIQLQKLLQRSELNSTKSERFTVYIGSFDEKSPLVYTYFFRFDETLNDLLSFSKQRDTLLQRAV